MPSTDEIQAARAVYRGTDWGEPLWTLVGKGWTVDVHGADEADARRRLLEAQATSSPPAPAVTDDELRAALVAAVPGADMVAVDAAMARRRR